jgi:hypothetical protein
MECVLKLTVRRLGLQFEGSEHGMDLGLGLGERKPSQGPLCKARRISQGSNVEGCQK